MRKGILVITILAAISLISFLAFDYYTLKQNLNAIMAQKDATAYLKLNILLIEQGNVKNFSIISIAIFIMLVGINLIYEVITESSATAGGDLAKFEIKTQSPGILIIAIGACLLASTLVFKGSLHINTGKSINTTPLDNDSDSEIRQAD